MSVYRDCTGATDEAARPQSFTAVANRRRLFLFMSALALPADIPASSDGRAQSQLLVEAAKARAFGKHFVAAILESLSRILPSAPETACRIESWPGDLAGAGVIFRLNAGLHALARSGNDAALQALYEKANAGLIPAPERIDHVLGQTLRHHESSLLAWMAGPTQTNEVARVAGLTGALLEVNRFAEMPVELFELGCSAGLNLNLAHYRCQLGSTAVGPLNSLVRIAPEWRGNAVPGAALAIACASGVDLNPLDITRHDDCERLHAYIWAGEPERSARLDQAIAIARRHPPAVEAGTASQWLRRRLAGPQQPGTRRVVFHSMVAQYMPQDEREAVDAAIQEAAAHASADRALVRIAMEWSGNRSCVELRLTIWDGGTPSSHLVAHCHPYGEWFDWFGIA